MLPLYVGAHGRLLAPVSDDISKFSGLTTTTTAAMIETTTVTTIFNYGYDCNYGCEYDYVIKTTTTITVATTTATTTITITATTIATMTVATIITTTMTTIVTTLTTTKMHCSVDDGLYSQTAISGLHLFLFEAISYTFS